MISGTDEARIAKFYMPVEYTNC